MTCSIHYYDFMLFLPIIILQYKNPPHNQHHPSLHPNHNHNLVKMGWMGYDLQDVSSRDFERLLAYMYHGEVIIYIHHHRLAQLVGSPTS